MYKSIHPKHNHIILSYYWNFWSLSKYHTWFVAETIFGNVMGIDFLSLYMLHTTLWHFSKTYTHLIPLNPWQMTYICTTRREAFLHPVPQTHTNQLTLSVPPPILLWPRLSYKNHPRAFSGACPSWTMVHLTALQGHLLGLSLWSSPAGSDSLGVYMCVYVWGGALYERVWQQQTKTVQKATDYDKWTLGPL